MQPEQLTLDQIRAFLNASEGMRLKPKPKPEIYQWIEDTLVHHQYQRQGRKGLLRQYPGENDQSEPGAGDPAHPALSAKREEAPF